MSPAKKTGQGRVATAATVVAAAPPTLLKQESPGLLRKDP